MELKEIVKEWLKQHNYDGLFNDDCGCIISDLMPCNEPGTQCEAGHATPCPGPETCENGGGCLWHIGPKQNC